MFKESAPRARRVNQTVRNATEAPRGLSDERFLRSRQRSHEVYRLDPSRIPNHLVSSDEVRGNRKKLPSQATSHRMR